MICVSQRQHGVTLRLPNTALPKTSVFEKAFIVRNNISLASANIYDTHPLPETYTENETSTKRAQSIRPPRHPFRAKVSADKTNPIICPKDEVERKESRGNVWSTQLRAMIIALIARFSVIVGARVAVAALLLLSRSSSKTASAIYCCSFAGAGRGRRRTLPGARRSPK